MPVNDLVRVGAAGRQARYEPGHRQAPTAAVETVLRLQQVDLFTGASTTDLLALASRSRVTAVEAGAALVSEADAPAMVVLMSANATVERPDGSRVTEAAAGDIIGAFAALTGRSSAWRAYASSSGSVLRIESEDLLQVFGERIGLLQRVIAKVVLTEHRGAALAGR